MSRSEKILHFLRNFPAWIVLLALFIILVLLYRNTGDLAYKEWASLALASLFTALGIQRASNSSLPQTEVNADTVNADIKTNEVSLKQSDIEKDKNLPE